jgi:hypothetical protein
MYCLLHPSNIQNNKQINKNMKKILLTMLAAGLVATTAYSQEAPFELYEGDSNDSKLIKINPQPDVNGDIEPLSTWSGNLRGVAYHSDAIADNNFSGEGALVYYLEDYQIKGTGPGQLNGSDYDNTGVPIANGYFIVTEGMVFNPLTGVDEFGPALRPVVKSNTYKGAPIILNVHAEQDDFNESKDVLLSYYLLLGQDKGAAYIEYWYRPDVTSSWQKLDPQYLNNESWATGEGLTSKSGRHENVWQAGVQLGNQVKTSNAQIRVTANYGGPSGWDGNGEFTATSGAGGGGNAESGVYELFDPADPYGVSYWDEFNPEGYQSSVDKRDSILGDAGLVSVGTYNDGVQEYPVYDFTGKESFIGQFAYGLDGHVLFSINDTNIIRVQLQTGSGPE